MKLKMLLVRELPYYVLLVKKIGRLQFFCDEVMKLLYGNFSGYPLHAS